MRPRPGTAVVLVQLLVAAVPRCEAEVLVRWTEDHVPVRAVLGVSELVVPAAKRPALREALTHGYRVYLEGDAATLATATLPAAGLAGVVVSGNATRAQLSALRLRLEPKNARVIVLDERGKWPHIRSNWVTKHNDVLQVAGRSAQPWIETNAALIRIAQAGARAQPPALTYTWTPLTIADADEGPAVENYLVAIAEAGSFGADLVLPVHERFQRRLLLGHPDARRDWAEIRRHIEFYSGNLPNRHEPVAAVGVVTSAPLTWFEVMNLLARHNVAFELIDPSELRARARAPLKLLVVLDAPDAQQAAALAEFERSGGVVNVTQQVADPNRFALQIRQQLGRDRRPVDVWNGITVLAAPFKEPGGANVLLTLVNYAHQALPVQLRVPGTFSQVHFESPDELPAPLPYQHRDAHTEVVVPALRVGGRIFFSR